MERVHEGEQAPPAGRARPEAGAPGGLTAFVLGAQGLIGNRGVAGLARAARAAIHRQGAPPDPTTAPAPAGQGFADAAAFAAHGPFGPEDVVAGPAGRGGFEATYDPKTQTLSVVMRCRVDFRDALHVQGDAVTPDIPELAGLAAKLPPPGPQRTAYVARYQWQQGEREAWLAKLEPTIEKGWTAPYGFHVNRPGWEHVGATVAIDIQAHADEANGDEHMTVTVTKFPPGEGLASAGGTVGVDPGEPDDPRDQVMMLSSGDLDPRSDNALVWQVHFPINSASVATATVTTQGKAKSIGEFAKEFNGSKPGTPGGRPATVSLIGHASQSGDAAYNQALSQRRADNVRAALVAHGFRNVATRVDASAQGEEGASATEDPADRRVDMLVDGGDAQVTAVHEWGHAFGLADEYSYGGGRTTGDRAAHDPQVQDMLRPGGDTGGAVVENNDNIMSMGNRVLPQHYAMFHVALSRITGIPDWALGAPSGAGGGPP